MSWPPRRLRFLSEDGDARGTKILAVNEDGAEVPVDYVITRAELSCDAEDGTWHGRIWIDVPAVPRPRAVELRDVLVDIKTNVDVQPAVAHAADKES